MGGGRTEAMRESWDGVPTFSRRSDQRGLGPHRFPCATGRPTAGRAHAARCRIAHRMPVVSAASRCFRFLPPGRRALSPSVGRFCRRAWARRCTGPGASRGGGGRGALSTKTERTVWRSPGRRSGRLGLRAGPCEATMQDPAAGDTSPLCNRPRMVRPGDEILCLLVHAYTAGDGPDARGCEEA